MIRVNTLFFGFMMIFGSLSCLKQDRETIPEDDEIFFDSIVKLPNQNAIHIYDSILMIDNLSEARYNIALVEKGTILYHENKFEKALKCLNESIHFFETYNHTEYTAEILYLSGSCNTFLANGKLGTEQLLSALRLYEKLDDDITIANIYSTIAHTYYVNKDFETAISHILKAIDIQEKINYKTGLSGTYNNLAVVYKNLGQFDNAILYNEKSLSINQQNNDSSSIAKSYNNLGLIYEEMEDYDLAISFYKKAIILNDKSKLLISSPLQNLASHYQNSHNFKLAKQYYLKALQIENNLETIIDKIKITEQLLNIALLEMNFEDAIKYQKSRDALYAIQTRDNHIATLRDIKNQYLINTSKRELEQVRDLNKKNKILFFTIISLLLVLALFSLQVIKRKQLGYAKEKVDLEQRVLSSQMNPHFIFNVLSAIQNSLLDNTPIKSAGYLAQFAKLIRQNFDFIEKESISLYYEIQALENYVNIQQLRFNEKFEFNIEVDANIDLNDTFIPPLLLQPFIENSIEHGFKNINYKGIIILSLEYMDGATKCEIHDNGSGFVSDILHKDTKLHSIDVFKKRLKLLNPKSEKSFKIHTSSNGTSVSFIL